MPVAPDALVRRGQQYIRDQAARAQRQAQHAGGFELGHPRLHVFCRHDDRRRRVFAHSP